MLIGIDVDDVLADTTTPLIKFHNDIYGTSLLRDQIFTYSLWKVWGGTREEAVQKVFEFYDSDYFKNIKPVPGSVWSVENLSKDHSLVVVTSRLEPCVEETKEWVKKYFHNKFKDIYFANNVYAQDGKERSKLEICLELGVDLLIEDSLEYAMECAEKRIKVLLLDCPWNQSEKLSKNITRVYNWNEIVDIINRHKA